MPHRIDYTPNRPDFRFPEDGHRERTEPASYIHPVLTTRCYILELPRNLLKRILQFASADCREYLVEGCLYLSDLGTSRAICQGTELMISDQICVSSAKLSTTLSATSHCPSKRSESLIAAQYMTKCRRSRGTSHIPSAGVDCCAGM